MKIKRSILAPTVVALIALATGGWLLQQGVSQEKNVYFQARLFEEVLHHVSDRFVDQKEPSALYRMAIDGMLQQLGDPHSTFMSPEDYERLRVQTQGEYGGIGIEIGKRNGWITVISPLPGTPAERAGMQSGDQLIEVDGVSTKNWSEDEAVSRIKGPKGSEVNIKVARSTADQPIPFKITREAIHVKSVPASYMLAPNIGYVDLTVFGESSADEVKAAIDRMRAKGMKGLVLDLRYNPGGLLDAGVALSDMFLKKGDLVSETRSRVPTQNQKLNAEGGDLYAGMPIVVLVNPYSASASEIMAGALQDHDRALILGQTTYGKGSVQTLFPLPNNNWLKLTTARWYTPSGRSIQKPYGIGAHEGATPADSAADDETPTTTTKDSANNKPIFRTDSGRKVYGGGGIHPDVVVMPDTFSTSERAFLTALQKSGSKYGDARFTFGVRYAQQHPELKPNFPVTPDMLESFYKLLNERGIAVDRTVFNGASTWVSKELGAEVTRAKWGREEVNRRANSDDPQVRAAIELLQKSPDPKALFVAADHYGKQHATVVGEATVQKPAMVPQK
jgi:carboxyl-terminal processing protease